MPGRLLFCVLVAALGVGGGPLASDDRPLSTMPFAVVDQHGQTVRNLAAADVEVREGGQPRPISSLSFRGASPRTIAIFLDEYHVSSGVHTERVQAAASKLLDDFVRPDDSLYVMLPLDSQQGIGKSSIQQARDRIRLFAGRKDDPSPRAPFEREYMSSAPVAIARERAQIARSAVQALATAMRDPLDAPKALVLLTEGFSTDERTRSRTTTWRNLARAARLANVPVYVVDPSLAAPPQPILADNWQSLVAQTGGAIFSAGHDPAAAIARVGTDLGAQYLVSFEPAGAVDGGFHGVDLLVKKKGLSVRAPSGYWAAFPASRFPPVSPRLALLTPHVSGLIQPWFRMAPGADGRTRVTFLWAPRGSGRAATSIDLKVLTFEGAHLHESRVASRAAGGAGEDAQTTFEVPPGPVQVSMAIHTARGLLASDVRYIEVPRLDAARPVITSIEFVRPRSLPEFLVLRNDAGALPTEVRDFVRQDRLLVRVRAFHGLQPAAVRVRLQNRLGDVLADLPALGIIDGAAQFELALARFPRGDYRLEIVASGGDRPVVQLQPIRLIG